MTAHEWLSQYKITNVYLLEEKEMYAQRLNWIDVFLMQFM